MKRYPLAIESLERRQLLAAHIVLDYSLDANGFFADATRRASLQQAADMINERLMDSLNAITLSGVDSWKMTFEHPATGLQTEIANPTVATDVIPIYVGARDLGGNVLGRCQSATYIASGMTPSWRDNIESRGEPGAVSIGKKTDFAPIGASVAFDIDTDWFYGETTSGLTYKKSDFLSVALHEFMHALGFGATGSYFKLYDSACFTGAKSAALFGGNVPLEPDGHHWKQGTTYLGYEPVMSPASTSGERTLPTELDFAALDDIGWEISPPVRGTISGKLFLDANANGTKDAGEDDAARQAAVFIDVNMNSVLDSNEVPRTVNNDGIYAFTDLAPGTYRICVTWLLSAWQIKVPSPNAYYDITLAAGESVTGKDFIMTQADLSPPQVKTVVGPAAGLYRAGQALRFTATTSERVVVKGVPTLPLVIGSTTRQAAYDAAASTPTSLVFSYTLQSGDTDTNGIAVGKALVTASGVSVQDAAGNRLLAPIKPPATALVTVDTAAPKVATVKPPAAKTYLEGQAIDFVVTLNEPVRVSGTPRLPLTVGTTARIAAFAGFVPGTGERSLLFRSVTRAGDVDGDGITVGSSLKLGGATILDAAGNAAVLTLPAVNVRRVFVDAVAPSIVAVTSPALDAKGTRLMLRVEFSEPVIVTGKPTLAFTLGGSTRQFVFSTGSKGRVVEFSYAVKRTDDMKLPVVVGTSLSLAGGKIRDTVGNAPATLRLPLRRT